MWLGDMAFDEEQFEEALQFYRYLGTMLNSPPWTVWWIDLYVYGHLAAQRLAMCYSALGRAEEALVWARQVADLLPEGTPPEAWTECENNVRCLEEALGETAHKEQEVNAST
jgi:tetratricopeptide (TPR) repeat protein